MQLNPLRLPKARILVLEDERVRKAALCNLLSAAGYGLADSAESRVDLVLIGTGPHATPQLSACAAPIILLVDRKAWLGFDFFDTADALGATAVLQRPFPHAALLRLVEKVLAAHGADCAPAEDDDSLPSLADLLFRLENPNLAG